MQISIVQKTVRRVSDNIGHSFLVNKLHLTQVRLSDFISAASLGMSRNLLWRGMYSKTFQVLQRRLE